MCVCVGGLLLGDPVNSRPLRMDPGTATHVPCTSTHRSDWTSLASELRSGGVDPRPGTVHATTKQDHEKESCNTGAALATHGTMDPGTATNVPCTSTHRSDWTSLASELRSGAVCMQPPSKTMKRNPATQARPLQPTGPRISGNIYDRLRDGRSGPWVGEWMGGGAGLARVGLQRSLGWSWPGQGAALGVSGCGVESWAWVG